MVMFLGENVKEYVDASDINLTDLWLLRNKDECIYKMQQQIKTSSRKHVQY